MGLLEGIKNNFFKNKTDTVSSQGEQCSQDCFVEVKLIEVKDADEAEIGLDSFSHSADENKKDENIDIAPKVAVLPNGDIEYSYYDNNGTLAKKKIEYKNGESLEIEYSDEANTFVYKDKNDKMTRLYAEYKEGNIEDSYYDEEGNITHSIIKNGNWEKTYDKTPEGDVTRITDNGVLLFESKSNKDNNPIYVEKTINGKRYVYDKEVLSLLSKTTRNNLSINENLIISDRLMSDIEMVRAAEKEALKAGKVGSEEFQNVYDAYIKSHMIKTPENKEDKIGEIIEREDGLYVVDYGENGNIEVQLDISAERYLELFSPISRYDVNQGDIKDCFFLAPLVNYMNTPSGYCEILKSFSEDEDGNITIRPSGLLGYTYPVTFEKGELKDIDGETSYCVYKNKSNQAKGSKGIQMLEQAYAIASFTSDKKTPIERTDIDEAFNEINRKDGGHETDVYGNYFGLECDIQYDSQNVNTDFLDLIAEKINNNEKIYGVSADYGDDARTVDYGYNIDSRHAYNIEYVDTENKTIHLTNPHYCGCTTIIPYDDFINTFGNDREKRTVIIVNL